MNNIIFTSLSYDELRELIKGTIREELNKKNEKELLNVREACELLDISRSALNKWKSENKIPYKRLGKRIYFNRKDLLDALKDSDYKKIKELKL